MTGHQPPSKDELLTAIALVKAGYADDRPAMEALLPEDADRAEVRGTAWALTSVAMSLFATVLVETGLSPEAVLDAIRRYVLGEANPDPDEGDQ